MIDSLHDRLQLLHQIPVARRGRSQQGMIERPVGTGRTGLVFRRKVPQQPRQKFRRVAGIGFHHSDDGSDIDIVVLGVPAIEIGDHGDRRVGNLGLAGEFGFGHRGHADDVAASGLIG